MGLPRLVVGLLGCLFWTGLTLSVGVGVWVRVCVGAEKVVRVGVEFWVVLGAGVFVWTGATTGGRSLGFRPLFLPVVAPFLTSALIPLFSGALLLLLETTWLAAARNQF